MASRIITTICKVPGIILLKVLPEVKGNVPKVVPYFSHQVHLDYAPIISTIRDINPLKELTLLTKGKGVKDPGIDLYPERDLTAGSDDKRIRWTRPILLRAKGSH
jgi:hypothetical protein